MLKLATDSSTQRTKAVVNDAPGMRIGMSDGFRKRARVLSAFVLGLVLAGIGVSAQAEKLPYLYVMRSNRTAEERLLEKLFGKSSDEIIVSEIGFGISFVDGSFSADAIRGFVSRHSGSYGDEESEYLKRIADGEDPAEVLSGYNDTEDIGSGFGSLVAKAMREETGINFVFYHNVREEKDALSAVIVNRDEYQNYDLEELKKFSRGYAEELGLAEYGECVVYVYQFIDSDMRFSVDTEERKEQ